MKTCLEYQLAGFSALLLVNLIAAPALAEEEDDEDSSVELSGSLELEHTRSWGDSGKSYGTVFNADIEAIYHLADTVALTTSVSASASSDESDVDLDEAYITWKPIGSDKWMIHAGRKSLAFGKHETALLSDTLPDNFGSSKKNKVLEFRTNQEPYYAYAYLFDGTAINAQKNKKFGVGHGLGVGYKGTFSGYTTEVGLDFISNLAEADGFAGGNVSRKLPAISLHKSMQMGRVTVRGEHTFALKSPKMGDMGGAITHEKKPSAHQLEVAYDLQNNRKLAVAWNTTRHAEGLGLDKRYVGVAYKQPLYQDVYGAIELGEGKDYAGNKDRRFMVQVGYEF